MIRKGRSLAEFVNERAYAKAFASSGDCEMVPGGKTRLMLAPPHAFWNSRTLLSFLYGSRFEVCCVVDNGWHSELRLRSRLWKQPVNIAY